MKLRARFSNQPTTWERFLSVLSEGVRACLAWMCFIILMAGVAGAAVTIAGGLAMMLKHFTR